MGREDVLRVIKDTGVIAIIRHIPKDLIKPTVDALYEGGVRCIEVTANTDGAIEMVINIVENYSDKVIAGAGTVIDEVTAKNFIRAGARFLLSPSLHKEVIDAAKDGGVVSIPGAYTPTEIIQAYKWGGDIVKVFPAVVGGTEYIKQIRGPFSDIPLLAVGGINVDNASDFISAGCMGVGVGSGLVNPALIQKGEFEQIKLNASRFIASVKNGRRK